MRRLIRRFFNRKSCPPRFAETELREALWDMVAAAQMAETVHDEAVYLASRRAVLLLTKRP